MPQDLRILPRISLPFPTIVRGVDATGTRFETSTAVENLSGGGIYMHLAHPLEAGAKLFVSIRMALSTPDAEAPHIAARGHVLRVKSEPDGRIGVALKFDHTRWLYRTSSPN